MAAIGQGRAAVEAGGAGNGWGRWLPGGCPGAGFAADLDVDGLQGPVPGGMVEGAARRMGGWRGCGWTCWGGPVSFP